MRISAYLQEIEHAIRHVIGEVHREHAEVKRLRAEIESLTREVEDGYRRSEWLALNPDLDDEGMGTATYWDTYFGSDKERFYKNRELESAVQRIAAHEFSIAALAGSLLQYAKQGIAVRFGKHRNGVPNGRLIAGIPLHEIVWQGRNQALHWEDGVFHKATESCFQRLASSIHPAFGDYRRRSMAFDVVTLLGWNTFEDVERDLLLLDP